MKKQLFIFFSVLILLSSASFTYGQVSGTKPIYPIEFKNGKRVVVYEGTVSLPAGEGDMFETGVETYSITIKQDTRLLIEVTSDEDQAAFSLTDEGRNPLKDSSRIRKWKGTLTKPGTYYLIVLTTKGHAKFKLKVTKL